MDPQKRCYSVLLVSAADSFNEAMTPLLPHSKYTPILTVNSISAAKRALAERPFDHIIINSPLPDGSGTAFAVDAVRASGTVVLLMVRSELHEEIYDKVAPSGVFTLPKPMSKPTMATALCWMASSRERLRNFEKKNLSIEEKMEEIRIVNRAKWLLISEMKMEEPDAHRFIEKQAMDNCISKRDVAERIIDRYSKS